jgi:hypothetical protein
LKTFFSLALSGLSEAEVKQVLATLDSPGLDKWSLSEGGNSDLLIVDVDSVWGHMDWLRALAEGRHSVAYTEQKSIRDCEILLRKPLDSNRLAEILLQLQNGDAPTRAPAPAAASTASPAPRQSPATEPVAEAPAPVSKLPEHEPEVAYTPASQIEPAAAIEDARDVAANSKDNALSDESQTVGDLLLTGGITEPVLVELAGDLQLVIDPTQHVYRAPPQLKPIQKLLDAPLVHMHPVAADDEQLQHAGPQQPMVRLLWFAALSASEGQLAPHLDPDAIWRLTRWPQIEREFPRHFRIATAMMKRPGTLEEVAAAAKSPVEDVAAFINAYYLAGYVAPEGSNEPVEAANSAENVLSRLNRNFSRSARDTA